MKNKYVKLRDKQQQEVDDFPMFFAFSEEQFKEGLNKWGVTKKDLLSISLGGFIQKKDSNKWGELSTQHYEESEEARKDDEYVYQMFRYELGNHEYCINYDYTDNL